MRISKSFIVVLAIIFLLAASYFTAFTQDQSAPAFQRAYITGTITADGKPCGGARVRASSQTGEAECISASNGHYALGVGEGTWKVDVSKEGYKSPPTKTASVEALRSKDQVDFNLAKSAAWIKGKTLTTDGKVLSQVMVTAGGAFAISDSNGNFTLSVDAGKHEVSAMKVNYTLQNTVTVQLNAGETKEIELRLKWNNSIIQGIVVDIDDNHPLDNAIVVAVSMPEGMEMPGLNDTDKDTEARGEDDEGTSSKEMPKMSYSPPTNKKGEFTVRVLAGTYMLMANRHGYTFPQEQMMTGGLIVKVADGETKSGIVIKLRKTGPAPEGTPEGQPGAYKLVGIASFTPNNVLHWTGIKSQDSEGEFEVLRSKKDLNDPKNTAIAILKSPVGMPGINNWSFTDETAVSGETYYYAVREVAGGKKGPLSNIIKITTK